jgi:hypothetical protein
VNWTEFAQMITAVGVLTSAALSWRNGRKLVEVHDLTKKVQEETNGMKDTLIKTTEKKSHAEGIIEGKAIEKANPS